MTRRRSSDGALSAWNYRTPWLTARRIRIRHVENGLIPGDLVATIAMGPSRFGVAEPASKLSESPDLERLYRCGAPANDPSDVVNR